MRWGRVIRSIGIVGGLAVVVCVAGALPVGAATARTVCPAQGISHQTINGGLIVTGNMLCPINASVIHGGIVITGGSNIDLERSTVTGGIWVRPRGEVEIGTTLFGGTKTVSTVWGGVHLRRPVDWDIESARIFGGFSARGGVDPQVSPTFCGNTVHDGMRVRNVTAAVSWIGDPTDRLTDVFVCERNRIHGTLRVSNSTGFEIEGNRVSGSVILRASGVELNGNRIRGSLLCQRGARLLRPEDPTDAHRNWVGGQNTCRARR